MQWFLKLQSSKSIISGDLIREKAMELAQKMGYHNFKASRNWVDIFMSRHCIKQYKRHGEAGSADTVNVVLGQEICNYFEMSADDIYHASLPILESRSTLGY